MSAATEEAIKKIHNMLKDRGFTYEGNRILSATYNRIYVRGPRRIEVCGWHGTGKRGTCRWFGDLKTLFSMYDTSTPDPIIDSLPAMIHNSSLAAAIEAHKTGIARAVDHIQTSIYFA
jgi:hypothetical protein